MSQCLTDVMHSKGHHNGDLLPGMLQGTETLAKGTSWNAKLVLEGHFVMLKRLCFLVFSFVYFLLVVTFSWSLLFVFCLFFLPRFVVCSYFSTQVSCRRCAVHCLSRFVSLHGLHHRVGKLSCFDKYVLFCVAAARMMRPHWWGSWSSTRQTWTSTGRCLIAQRSALCCPGRKASIRQVWVFAIA